MAADFDDYDYEELTSVSSDKVLVFIVSTFGEGDPTDNSVRFFSSIAALRAQAEKTSLHNLQYSAFGLGNRNYKYFNKMIDLIDETFATLGGHRLGPVGRADEAISCMSTQEEFSEWKENVLDCIRLKFKVNELEVVYQPAFDILPNDADSSTVYLGEPNARFLSSEPSKPRSGLNDPYAATVVVSKDLATDENRKAVHLEFDLSAAGWKYQTGDHIAVWPMNPDVEVERLCQLLGLSEDDRKQFIEIRSKDQDLPVPVPSPTTKETILRYYLELCGAVSPDVLRLLVQFCPTEESRDVLSGLVKDKNAFRTQVSSRCMTIGQVMEMVASEAVWRDVPFGLFVECLGKLQPRYYSIASSPSVTPRQPAVTVSITSKVLDPAHPDVRLQGVASNYLYSVKCGRDSEKVAETKGVSYQLEGPRSILSGGKVLVHLRRSTFKLPALPNRPIIMVAAGTGVAPFRAFVQERAVMAARGVAIGPMLLIFGCRSPTDGFFYNDEWEAYKTSLPLLEVVPAFSRHGEKMYVQDLLWKLRDRVSSLLDDDASLYICGSADMARNVRNKLTTIVADSKSWSEVQAERYLMGELKKARRLQEDVWTT